jgi:tetratricopeptide (TPR) repeat protein
MPDVPGQTTGAVTPLTLLNESAATHPWEDLATVLWHAEEARAANDPTRAYAFYARATELDPNHALAWAGRAATTSDSDEAIVSWGYAHALAPDDTDARAGLDRRVEGKIEQSESAQVASLVSLGHTLAEVGQKPWAYRLFARATELDDTNEEAWVWRAGLTDDIKETLSCLNQALALNPENAQAQAGLQWALAQQASAPEPASPAASEQAAQLVEKGQRLLQEGDPPRAHALFQRATELDQKNEAAWLGRGNTAAEVDEALACMECVLAINPENESAKEARSWLRIKKLRESAKARAPVVSPPARVPPISVPTMTPAQWPSRGVILVLVLAALLAILLIVLVVLFLSRLPW